MVQIVSKDQKHSWKRNCIIKKKVTLSLSLHTSNILKEKVGEHKGKENQMQFFRQLFEEFDEFCNNHEKIQAIKVFELQMC